MLFIAFETAPTGKLTSVFQAMDGRGDSAAAANEFGGGVGVEIHDRSRTKQTAEGDTLTRFFAVGGDDAHSRGLGVHHTDGDLVGNDAVDHFFGRVAGDRDHVKTHRANSRHRF